jgi:hypothetical protein
MNADQLKAAKRPERHAQALAALRKLKGPFAARVAALEKSVPPPHPISLPRLGEWTQSELGAPDIPGSGSFDANAGVFTITAAGADLSGNADNGHFIHRPLEGDGELAAHVISIQKADPAGKAGLMLRETLKPEARNVAIVVNAGGGLGQQQRAKAGGPTINVKANGSAPCWLKLVRTGDTITGYQSSDGQSWTEVAAQKLEKLPPNVFVGFAVTSHNTGKATTVKIDNVTFNPAR